MWSFIPLSPVHFSSSLYRYRYVEILVFTFWDNPRMSWANCWLCVLTPSSLTLWFRNSYLSIIGCNRKKKNNAFHQCACSMADIWQRFPVLCFVVFLLPLFVCGWFFCLIFSLLLFCFSFDSVWGFLFCLICLKPCKERTFAVFWLA